MLYKVFLTFESVDKILKCGHSNESFSSNTLLWYCLLTMKTEVVLTIECGWKSLSLTIQIKATEQYSPVALFIMLYKVVLTFESVGEIVKCGHSNESYWAVLSCGTVYYAVQGSS